MPSERNAVHRALEDIFHHISLAQSFVAQRVWQTLKLALPPLKTVIETELAAPP